MPTFENTLDDQGLALLKVERFTVNIPEEGGSKIGNFWRHGWAVDSWTVRRWTEEDSGQMGVGGEFLATDCADLADGGFFGFS